MKEKEAARYSGTFSVLNTAMYVIYKQNRWQNICVLNL